jgi:hypothetical protein
MAWMVAVLSLAWAQGVPAPVLPPNPAEYARLSQEMELLAGKNAWAGVEKVYQQIQATGVPLTVPVLVRGAESAQAAGDVGATRERLLLASHKAVDPEAEQIINWLYDLEKRYWHFRLRCDPESGLPPFEAKVQPFDPIGVRAIRFAQERMRADCAFSGMLPVGEYQLGSHAFVIVSGTPNPTTLDLRGEILSKSERQVAREKWEALGL